MILMLMMTYAVELIALALGLGLVAWAKHNECCMARWGGYLVTVLSLLTILGTLYAANITWKHGMMFHHGMMDHMKCDCSKEKAAETPEVAD